MASRRIAAAQLRSEHRRNFKSHDYALQQEKIARRKQLPPSDRVVVGAIDRAKSEVKTSMTTLLKRSGRQD